MLNIDKYIVKVEPMKRIGNVFPKNKLSLLHGLQGSGKSYSCIKALNNDNIKPIHINLDHSTGLECLDTYNVTEKFLIDLINKVFNKEYFKDQVIIIDTYTRLEDLIFSLETIKTKIGIFKLLEELQEYYIGSTLIIIGHTQPFVGRDGIFNDNLPLVRGCAEELWLEKITYKRTSKIKTHDEYILHIQKGRGINPDERIINNWMRD